MESHIMLTSAHKRVKVTWESRHLKVKINFTELTSFDGR